MNQRWIILEHMPAGDGQLFADLIVADKVYTEQQAIDRAMGMVRVDGHTRYVAKLACSIEAGQPVVKELYGNGYRATS